MGLRHGVISPPNLTFYKTVSVLLSLYPSLIIPFFYLPRFILLDFPSISSQTSLPFLSCHRTTTTRLDQKQYPRRVPIVRIELLLLGFCSSSCQYRLDCNLRMC